MTGLTRRDFVRNVGVGIAGAGIAWRFGGTLAWGDMEVKESTLLSDQTSLKISPMHKLGKTIINEYPAISFSDTGDLLAAWVEGDNINLAKFLDNELTDVIQINENNGLAFQVETVAWNGGIAVVWSEKTGSDWVINLRSYDGTKLSQLHKVSKEKGINWRPDVAVDSEGNLWIVWDRKIKNHFEVVARIYKPDGKAGEIFSISRSPDSDNCRPAIVNDNKGTVWIAWDRQEQPGNLSVYVAPFSNEIPGGEVKVTHHPAFNVAPSLAVDKDNRLWIGWHSNRKGDSEWDLPRWFYLRCYHNGKFYEPVSLPKSMNLNKMDTDQSFEFIKVYCTDDGKVIVTGRPSHNFCVQYYQGDQWSDLFRLPNDGWGGRGQYLKAAFDKAGDMWVVRRDIGTNILQKITGIKGPEKKIKLKRISKSIPAPAVLTNIYPKRNWENENGLNFYFGDLHAHTWMSDGVGDVDEFYLYQRDCYSDDFAVLTDHDNFVGNRLLDSEWEFIKEITDHFNKDGKFATIFGQEWTTARTPRGFGHKNVYSLDKSIPLFDHTENSSNTTEKLFAHCKKYNAIAIPHHIGWTGVDWENHDPEVQILVEIISNHGRFEFMGNEPIPHRGGNVGCFVQDGLTRGLKFGIVGGSDSHGLIWHHRVGYKRDCHRTGITCILAPELTREAIFEAMKKRQTYATTGIKPRIKFTINDKIIGEEFTTSEKPNIRVEVSCYNDLKWITIVKNNKDWYRYGGEGMESRFSKIDDEITPGESFYYLRVETEDKNMAWTSPIWVNYTG